MLIYRVRYVIIKHEWQLKVRNKGKEIEDNSVHCSQIPVSYIGVEYVAIQKISGSQFRQIAPIGQPAAPVPQKQASVNFKNHAS